MDKAELNSTHDLSSCHREEILASEKCGCFCCLETFSPSEIVEWIDRKQTAICPRCGVDSVLPGKSVKLSSTLLLAMHVFWFAEAKKSSSSPPRPDYPSCPLCGCHHAPKRPSV